jgi:predicted PurR-regulated permease PerM
LVGLLVAALVFLVVGAARGLLRRPGGLTLQAAGMLVFGATALAALYVDLDLGGYLVAAGLIGHAAWDAVHYLRNRVVARSYAEFCAVLDLLVGAAIPFLA